MRNLLTVPPDVASEGGSAPEFCETLMQGTGARVERIISHGHVTPENTWYDQGQDEWVTVVEGEAAIAYPDGTEVFLRKGDYLFLPRHARHRVAHTSSPCIWLAVFADAVSEAGSEA